MNVRVIRTRSEEETIALGEEIARTLPRPAVVLLIGDLGAGKTTLAKGIVKGLGAAAPEDVSSPTYPLIHEFGEKDKVYHIDLYRLERESEVLALGLDDLLDGNSILLVEWGERFPALWPADRIEIRLVMTDEDVREITVTEQGGAVPLDRGRRPRRPSGSGSEEPDQGVQRGRGRPPH